MADIIQCILVMIILMVKVAVADADSLDKNQCTEYKGKICKSLDHNLEEQGKMFVYVGWKYNETLIENQIRYLLQTIRHHPYTYCIEVIRRVLCYQMFPVCYVVNGRPTRVQETCRQDCEKTKKHLCNTAVKDIPELSGRLLGVSCMTMPFGDCLNLDIPTTHETIEESCRLDSYGDKKESVSVLHVDKIKSSRRMKSLSSIIHKKDLNKTLYLNNLQIENFKARLINEHSNTVSTDHQGMSITVLLGKLKSYTPDQYLSLRNIAVSVMKKASNVFITGKGNHNLCGTMFQYNMQPESNDAVVFHATSSESISLKLIEMSHRVRTFPKGLEYILVNKFKLFQTMIIYSPIWSIAWNQGDRISAFKGNASLNVNGKNIRNVETEIVIGAERKFWIMRLKMNLSLRQLMKIFVPGLTDHIPLVKKIVVDDAELTNTLFTFSTSNVKLPVSKYLKDHYNLYGDIHDGLTYEGMSIKTTGKAGLSTSLSSLYGGKHFDLKIDTHDSHITTFKIHFRIDQSSIECKPHKRARQEWNNFMSEFKELQQNTGTSEEVIRERIQCNHCCALNIRRLESINGRIKARFTTSKNEPKVKYHLDLNVTVHKNENRYIYQLKNLRLPIVN